MLAFILAFVLLFKDQSLDDSAGATHCLAGTHTDAEVSRFHCSANTSSVHLLHTRMYIDVPGSPASD